MAAVRRPAQARVTLNCGPQRIRSRWEFERREHYAAQIAEHLARLEKLRRPTRRLFLERVKSHFRTCKHQPDRPVRFASLLYVGGNFAGFMVWSNNNHHHEGWAMFKLADVFDARRGGLSRLIGGVGQLIRIPSGTYRWRSPHGQAALPLPAQEARRREPPQRQQRSTVPGSAMRTCKLEGSAHTGQSGTVRSASEEHSKPRDARHHVAASQSPKSSQNPPWTRLKVVDTFRLGMLAVPS